MLALPDETLLTESAAIILYLADLFPTSGLAPSPHARDRPYYLRRLIWLVAAVYPTFSFTDYPQRWSSSRPDELAESVSRHREILWREWESDLQAGGWALGETFSALDLYIAVMRYWSPGYLWFRDNCPKLYGIARRVDQDPRLGPVIRRNFPLPSPSRDVPPGG